MSARRSLLLLALPLAAACAGTGESSWAGTVTDSAGVAIVQNPSQGAWAQGKAWTVQEALSIGEMAGEAEYQFGQITGVDVDDAGNVYVADAQAGDVRVYDNSGAYLRTIGQPGSGPGELAAGPTSLAGLEVIGDQAFVADLGNQRLSRFSLDGEPLGDTHIDFAQAIPARWDEMPAGRLVAQLRHIGFGQTDAAPTGDAIRAVDENGAFADTVGMLPAGETVRIVGGRPQVKLFSPEPIWDADPSGVLVMGMNSEFRLQVHDAAGSLKRIVYFPVEPKPVTDRDKQVIKNTMGDLVRRQSPQAPAAAIDAYINSLLFADNYPIFASLALGPEGSIWAQRVRSGEELAGGEEGTFDPRDLGSPSWDVFDAQGRYLGMVTFPGKYQPVRVVGNRFYGVDRDELDVQRVKVYEVVMGG